MDALALGMQVGRGQPLPDPARALRLGAKRAFERARHPGTAHGQCDARADRSRPSTPRPTSCMDRSALRALLRSLEDGALTVWTHSQGVYPLRAALAEMLRMPEEQGALHPHGGLGLLRPQRRRRCRRRCRSDCRRAFPAARCACNGCASRSTPGSRTARPWWRACAPPSMPSGAIADWHYEVWSNAAFHPARRCRQPDAGMASGRPVHAADARADPAADRRRRPQRHSALPLRQHAHRPSLHPGDAGAGLGPARRSAPT